MSGSLLAPILGGNHFHLEQTQGFEALVQDELEDVWGTYGTVFDMCEVGGLRV